MFHADATTIRVAATRVADLGRAAGDAERYADTWTPVPSDATGEIFRNFRSTVIEVTVAVAETLDHLRRATAGTADELFLTATHYEATDQESAARSDAQLSRLDTVRGTDHRGTARGRDHAV